MEKLAPKRIENILVLTPMQEGMLFHYLQDPQSALYFEQLSLEISGEIDLKLFEDAWNAVIQSNEMLRTVFRWEKLEKPSQVILKEHQCSFVFHDLSDKEDIPKQRALAGIKSRDKDEGFDLTLVPFRVILCKLTKTQYEMIISNHHILYDGWSNGIILKEFFNTYRVLSKGEQTLPLSAKTSFKEYIKWLQSRDRKKHEYFWQEYLAGFEMAAELPIKRKNEETTGAGDYSISLGEDIQNKLDSFIKNNKVTLASIFYSAWGILLQRYCGSEDVVFGTTVSGRSAGVIGIEDMVGLFINTIPLRINTNANEKIIDMVSQVDHVLHEREEFEHTPLVDIQRCSSLDGGVSLFDTILAIENYPLDDFVQGTHNLSMENNLISVHSYSMVETTHYDLTVGIMPFKGIEIKFSFKQELFEKDAIENLAGHFKTIIQTIVNYPGMVLSQLEIISIEEKNRILNEFNNTAVAYPRDKTIHQLFTEQAFRAPDHIALVGATAVETLRATSLQTTYRQLNDQSDHLAGLLIEKGVLPDTIVGIMMERSVEMIIGIMGILKSGGAYLPIDPECPQERIDYMLKDSNAKLLVTTSNLAKESEKVGRWEGEKVLLEEISNSTKGSSYLPTFLPSYLLNSTNLAYVIYTSGSSGNPKAVLVEHRNVIRLVKNTHFIDLRADDRILQTAALEFDASTFEIWGALLNGLSLYIVARDNILNPVMLKKLIVVYRITTMWFTSPLFNKLVEGDVDIFKGLRQLLVGGDVLSPTHIGKTRREFPGLHIINGYGPTENTTFSTTFLIDKEYTEKIPIGKPITNSTAYIVDKNRKLQPVGIVGELWVGGDGVARGYLNNPELTADRFYRSYWSYKTDILYKTGDLARWLPDGNIEFLGRIDNQVKIRGFRIETEEIENRLLKHEQVKEAVITVKKDTTGDKYLTAYFVSNREIPGLKLKEYLSKDLPGYMIPSCFIRLEKMPLTANGKVDRKSLPGPEIEGVHVYAAPRNKIEERLVEIWFEVLGIESASISIDDNFFELGGHSLKATLLAAKIHKAFDVNIPLKGVFTTPTVRGLSAYINRSAKDRYISIAPAEKKEYYSLSSAQKRLYILQQMEETRTSYNMFHAVVLNGDISKEKFEEVFRKMIQRYEVLRTSFEMIAKEPVQRIHDEVEFEMEYYDLATDEHGQTRTFLINFLQPFDLSRAPLLRAGLIKETGQRHILVLDMHHIAVDGTSVGIFINEFIKLYSGAQLPPVKLQYKDFSEWQRKWVDSGGLKSQEEYWLREFEGDIPLLDLPFDYGRPAEQTFDFDRVVFEANKELTARIKKLVSETEATLYMVLLAAYCILLAKYGDQEDIVIGTGVVGRTHPDTEQIVGMFVNMLALRSYPRGNKTLGLFLEEMKASVLVAFDNQDYPFDELVKKLNLKREYGRNPLFDTEFTFQDAGASVIEIPGLKVEPYEYENSLLKFDLSLTAFEADEQIHLILGFSPRLFKLATIETMAKHFLELLEQFPGNKNKVLKELKITVEHHLSAAEPTFDRGDYTGFEF